MQTLWRSVFGLGVAGGLLAGTSACTQEATVESERIAAEFDRAAAEPEDGREQRATEADRLRAEQGDADAQALLAAAYYNGRGVDLDYGEALRWARLAAEQGNARGQSLLGAAYYSGSGVAQDHAEAARWARLAAEQGDAGAQAILGVLYLNGSGVPQDDVSAYVWLAAASSRSAIAGPGRMRDRLAGRMTPEQLAEAEARLRDWNR